MSISKSACKWMKNFFSHLFLLNLNFSFITLARIATSIVSGMVRRTAVTSRMEMCAASFRLVAGSARSTGPTT